MIQLSMSAVSVSVFCTCEFLQSQTWLEEYVYEVHAFSRPMSNVILMGLFVRVFVCLCFSLSEIHKYQTIHCHIAIEVFVFVSWLSLSHSSLTISTPPLAGNGGKSTNGWYEKD